MASACSTGWSPTITRAEARRSMTEVRFYHLQRIPLERALPQLLEKTLERGWRAVVMAGSGQSVAALDSHLLTYGKASFLPHGTAKDGPADHQPVWLPEAEEQDKQ